MPQRLFSCPPFPLPNPLLAPLLAPLGVHSQYGLILTPPPFPQIPGGWAAQLYGGRRMLILSFATWSVVSLLTPGSADKLGRIITARVCVGLAQGFIIPAVHTVLAQVGPRKGSAEADLWVARWQRSAFKALWGGGG